MLFKVLLLIAMTAIAGFAIWKASKSGKNPLVSILVILCLGVLALILISFFLFDDFFGFLVIFPWAAQEISDSMGIHVWLARSLAIPASLFLLYAFRSAFSVTNVVKRQQGLLILGGVMFVFSLTMFFMEKNYVFSSSGGIVKCYATTPNDYEEVACNKSVHPVFGTPVIKDPNQIRGIAQAQWITKHDIPKVDRIVPTKDLAFFSPGGEPLLWYYQYPDGKIDFFGRPGIHPQLNVMLSPINTEIASLTLRYMQERKGNLISSASSGQTGTNTEEFERLQKVLSEIKF
jgi:4-amino-4-deoxy-L-arabinose transferase-like glycosyltransferase